MISARGSVYWRSTRLQAPALYPGQGATWMNLTRSRPSQYAATGSHTAGSEVLLSMMTTS